MSLMSFLIGAAGAAGAMHILSLSLDDYTASLNFANYKNAGAARESFKPPFSIQPYLKKEVGEHPTFTAFRQQWNAAIWKGRDQVLQLLKVEDKSSGDA